MYRLGVRRDFVARHFLIGGDWGPENDLHSHHYEIELRLEGAELNRHGFIVDIVDVESNLNTLVEQYADHTLNDLQAFAGLNPSIENLSRILCTALAKRIVAEQVEVFTVTVWEDKIAWASYRLER